MCAIRTMNKSMKGEDVDILKQENIK